MPTLAEVLSTLRRSVLLYLLMASTVAAQSQPESPVRCDVPELVGYVAFDEPVCEAVAFLNERRFADALRSLERARATPILESPSVSVLGRIALVQAMMGRMAEARASAADAE